MYRMRKYMVAICVMIVVSLVSLLVVSALTYVFKWQADKAMIGIIVTYILAGLAGGLSLKIDSNIEVRRNMLQSAMLSAIFLSLLILCSFFVGQIIFGFSTRLFLVWILIACSIFGGMCVRK